jgi:histidine ammonia-lyase
MNTKQTIILNGEDLTPEDLVKIGSGHFDINLNDMAFDRIDKCRSFIEKG